MVVVTVRGKPNYLRWTLERWFEEVRSIIENEYNIKLEVLVIDNHNDYPIIEANNRIYFEGLPGEEGYLIEIVKRIIEDTIGASNTSK